MSAKALIKSLYSSIVLSYRKLIDGEDPKFAIWAILLLGILIVVAFPFILTRESITGIEFSTSGEIGDTIGGITAPFIALLASSLTFLAFWVQVRANKAQSLRFTQIDNDQSLTRFEGKFYELLKLHKENVSEFKLGHQSGRRAFLPMVKEFKLGYHIVNIAHETSVELKSDFNPLNGEELMDLSYIVFFMGAGDNSDSLVRALTKERDSFFIQQIMTGLKAAQNRYSTSNSNRVSIRTLDNQDYSINLSYSPFEGHMMRLGHYYRHLFQMVKFVANQSDVVVLNKYEYIKTIRAQLSSHEQVLLYYNGMSRLGKPWITNKYFTEYRMIKNIPIPLADVGITPQEQFGEKNEKGELMFEWDEI